MSNFKCGNTAERLSNQSETADTDHDQKQTDHVLLSCVLDKLSCTYKSRLGSNIHYLFKNNANALYERQTQAGILGTFQQDNYYYILTLIRILLALYLVLFNVYDAHCKHPGKQRWCENLINHNIL